MIPVNGKPVIGWILDDLLRKGTRAATVVLRADDEQMQHFVQWAYAGRLELSLALVNAGGTILHSLQAGLMDRPGDRPLRIVLGDTLIRDPFDDDRDFVYTGEVADSRRWCLVELNERRQITAYLDKQEHTTTTNTALAGFYQLLDGPWARECLAAALAAGGRELSQMLACYGRRRPIYGRPAQEWYDFGHIDNLVQARRRLLQPRYFNTLTVNPILNTITKVSENSDKLQNELDWYLGIPDELKVLTPRILSYKKENGRLQIVQEYYGYPSLAELYVYGDLHPDTWNSILRHVIRVHQEFCRHRGMLEPAAISSMYARKIWDRLELLQQQDAAWGALLSRPSIRFNGQTLRNVAVLRAEIDARAQRLVETASITVVHGDFCFSNALFDVNHQIIRLIDPRGSFGVKGVYGDSRYDVAKVRHSVAGLYDYIIADLFHLEEVDGGFFASVHAGETTALVAHAFDCMVEEAGYDLDEIRFIEALLFLSMLPLHQDAPRRQRMMYLTGLSRLNEVFECAS
jgi:dTDP-glucose pyrophosphorylase